MNNNLVPIKNLQFTIFIGRTIIIINHVKQYITRKILSCFKTELRYKNLQVISYYFNIFVMLKRETNSTYELLYFIDMCPHKDEVSEKNLQGTDSHKILTLIMHVRNDDYVLSCHI